MVEYTKLLEEAIFKSPLALLSIKDAGFIAKIREYLPFSTGFEIECHFLREDKPIPVIDLPLENAIYFIPDDGGKHLFNQKNFEEIPKIMAVDCSAYEQRYRIPYGINGLICLYLICEQLKTNSALNLGSGIHYHVDMTGLSKSMTPEILYKNEKWILEELDQWNFKGHIRRSVGMTKGGWLGLRKERDSMEFRCGDMSFDYSHLVYRIISANSIIRRLKEQIEEGFTSKYIYANPDTVPDNKEIIAYIKSHEGSTASRRMNRLKSEADRINTELQKIGAVAPTVGNNAKEVIKSRIQKMT